MKQSLLACCILVVTFTGGASRVSAQVSSKRHVDVTVTDSLHRFVTGLEPANFEVVENGVRRAITDFSNAGSPISIVVVSDEPLPSLVAPGREDELILARSMPEALLRLAALKNSRKVIAI